MSKKKKFVAKKATKKVAKKVAKKSAKKPSKKPVAKSPKYKDFGDWWGKVAQKKVDKIERDWLKENEPNDPADDGGGDHWHVNQMMHEGDAHNMTYDNAEEAFLKGQNGEKWEMSMSSSLFCDLDSVVVEAYEAGLQLKGH